MKIKEFGIFCSFLILLGVIFVALTTTILLPKTTIPIYDGITILLLISIFVIFLMFSNLQDIKKVKENLEIKNYQLETIFNNVDIALFLRSTDGKILTMNQANSDMLGYTSEEMIGKNIKDILKNTEQIEKTDKELIQTKKNVKYSTYVESNKGVGKHLKVGKFPLLDNKGNVSKIIVCYIDDTLEQTIEQTKNDFIETLTHDLRTPTITQIKALDLLLQGYFGDLPKNQVEIINQIKSSCIYMNDLIYTILDTYVLEKGKIKLNLAYIDIKDLTQEILQELNWFAEEKHKKFNLNADNCTKLIRADRLQLKRVMFNIISNAIKYGVNDTEIDINITDSDFERIDFQVINKSEFLTENDMPNIFDKYKTKTNSKITKISTGLGLYLSKQIIEQHQGEIYAKCNNNEECIFGFKLPKNLKNPKV